MRAYHNDACGCYVRTLALVWVIPAVGKGLPPAVFMEVVKSCCCLSEVEVAG